MRILIVDNNMDPACWGAAELRRYATASPDAVVTIRRGPHEDLPENLENFDKVIVSGSRASCYEKGPWVSALDRLIEKSVSLKLPFLGVCYGHQALNRVLGGSQTLGKSAHPEFGWTKIESLSPSALFQGLPETFYSFSAHFEEVCALPGDMKNIARSKDCDVQACQYQDLPIYGVQFHPERNIEAAEKTFSERRKKGEPKNLLHSKDSVRLFNPKVGETIFKNFLALGGS